MDTAIKLLTALLHLHPHIPQPMRGCLERNHDRIAQQAQEGSAETGVPPGVLLVVGFLESHNGCHPRSGGCWGAPISPTRRATAGTHHHAAVALQHSYEVCGRTWEGAISRFRCGLCRCPTPPGGGYTAVYAVGEISRLYTEAHEPVPADLFRAPAAPRARTAR